MYRNLTKEVSVGNVKIGGENPVAIQSMTNTPTEDVDATVEQILRLEAAGCEIIRCAVPTMEAAEALRGIKREFIFLLLQIFILITGLLLPLLKMVPTRSGLTRAISVQLTG